MPAGLPDCAGQLQLEEMVLHRLSRQFALLRALGIVGKMAQATTGSARVNAMPAVRARQRNSGTDLVGSSPRQPTTQLRVGGVQTANIRVERGEGHGTSIHQVIQAGTCLTRGFTRDH